VVFSFTLSLYSSPSLSLPDTKNTSKISAHFIRMFQMVPFLSSKGELPRNIMPP